MSQERKPAPPDGFVNNEPSEDFVNDSLGTVDPADTADTDPEDDAEVRREREGEKRVGR